MSCLKVRPKELDTTALAIFELHNAMHSTSTFRPPHLYPTGDPNGAADPLEGIRHPDGDHTADRTETVKPLQFYKIPAGQLTSELFRRCLRIAADTFKITVPEGSIRLHEQAYRENEAKNRAWTGTLGVFGNLEYLIGIEQKRWDGVAYCAMAIAVIPDPKYATIGERREAAHKEQRASAEVAACLRSEGITTSLKAPSKAPPQESPPTSTSSNGTDITELTALALPGGELRTQEGVLRATLNHILIPIERFTHEPFSRCIRILAGHVNGSISNTAIEQLDADFRKAIHTEDSWKAEVPLVGADFAVTFDVSLVRMHNERFYQLSFSARQKPQQSRQKVLHPPQLKLNRLSEKLEAYVRRANIALRDDDVDT